MSFAVRLVDAAHRPGVFAEIERDGELVAEAFAEGGHMHVALVDLEGAILWDAEEAEVRDALERAREALAEAGLV